MKMQITQTYAATPTDVWDIYFSDEYDKRSSESAGIRREVVSDEIRDGVRHTTHRIITDRAVPGPMRKAAGMDYVTYNQVNEYDAASGAMRWHVDTAGVSDRVTIKGETRVVAAAGGCTRTVDGAVEIRVPLLGRKMEKALLKGVEEAQQQQGEIIAQMLAERAAG